MIIGGGLGGLSAAVYARLLGYNVRLLEAGSSVGGKAASLRMGPYRLDPGPSIVILTRIYEQVFVDAGRKMPDYLRFNRLDPISRIYFKDWDPIDLPSDRGACEALVDKVAPTDGRAFRELLRAWDQLVPQMDKSIFAHPYDRAYQLLDRKLLGMALKFNMRQTTKELIDARFESAVLRAFFYGFPSYSGQTYDGKAHGTLMIPYLMLQEGVYFPEAGGVGAIPTAFERLARELGVEIQINARVEKLTTTNNRVDSAVMVDGSIISGESFVRNVVRFTTREWLGIETDVAPSLSYFTVHWGIRRRLDGLRHHNLLGSHRLREGLRGVVSQRRFSIAADRLSQRDSRRRSYRSSRWCHQPVRSRHLSCQHRWLGVEFTVVPLPRLVLKTMEGFGFSVEPTQKDFERIQTPVYFEGAHGNYKGSLYGAHESERLYGLFPPRNMDEQFRNLFYCGGSVQPGAGLPMVVLSGKFAAGKI